MKRETLPVLACLVLGCSSNDEPVFGSHAADSSSSEATAPDGGDAAKSDAQEGATKSTDGSHEAQSDAIRNDATTDAQTDAGDADSVADHLVESSTEAGDSQAIGDAGFDAKEYGTGPCPSSGGEMVRTPLGFCIDKTEVMKDEYLSWLATEPPHGAQIPECEWNTSFAQDDFCRQQARIPGGTSCHDNYAITCVDWCDARTFCIEHGKRLCGGIAGMPITPKEALNPAKSEWMAACTSGGKYEYPWGNEPWGNEPQTQTTGQCDMGTNLLCGGGQCHSPDQGYSAIVGMPSDALEWADACDERGCVIAGDGLMQWKCGCTPYDPFQQHECDGSSSIESIGARQAALPELGFRCCAD
jgi:formylglycine-generating enzyme